MKCRGKFKFKEIFKVEAGSFTSNGNTINYSASYKLKVDEKTEKGISERVFKIADNPENYKLIEDLSKLQEYTDFILEFDVVLYTNSVSIIPIAIVTK